MQHGALESELLVMEVAGRGGGGGLGGAVEAGGVGGGFVGVSGVVEYVGMGWGLV